MSIRTLIHILLRVSREEEGATAVEYAIMLAMIVLGCLSALNALSDALSGSFTDSSDKIADKMAGN